MVLDWLAKLIRVNVKKEHEKRHKGLLSKDDGLEKASASTIHDKVTLRKLRDRCSEIFKGSHVNVTNAPECCACNQNTFLTPDWNISACTSPNPSLSNLERAELGLSRTHLTRDVNGARGTDQRNLYDDYVLRSLLHSQECISRDVREIVHFVHEQEEGDEQKEEWVLVAHIVDQFFLYLFIMVLVLFSLIVFLNAPRYVFGL